MRKMSIYSGVATRSLRRVSEVKAGWVLRKRRSHTVTDWVPPIDTAHDILYVGSATGLTVDRKVMMEHAEPGCGNIVEQFWNHSLLLAQGNMGHAGYNLLLQW